MQITDRSLHSQTVPDGHSTNHHLYFTGTSLPSTTYPSPYLYPAGIFFVQFFLHFVRITYYFLIFGTDAASLIYLLDPFPPP